MVDVNITNSNMRNGKQPGHAPYGGRDADLSSNPDAEKVFPPTEDTKATFKPFPKEPDTR